MLQKNPYIGPRTFQRNEGHLFFGREREARDLIALVASERLVVFYAQSGAGKSSIINTRLIPNLEAKGYEVLPVGRVSGDLATGIEVDNIYIHNLIRSLEQHGTDPLVLSCLQLSEFLTNLNFDEKGFFYDPAPIEAIPDLDISTLARRALVIDQFEELFSTHPEAWEKRGEFFQQLAQAMQDDPQLWVVLVMREDYIATLDLYAHLVPGGLRVRYYMQRLGRGAALKAVKSPVQDIRPYAEGVAEKLIDDLCSIKVQKADGTLEVQPGQYVEPVQLQVVCYGLWENLSPEGTQITEKDLQDVGDVNQSLGKYYDRRVGDVAKAKSVRERLIREWFEKKLITAGGIRNMVLQERDSKPGELPDDVIRALQSDLVRAEKRGGATWYELTHDRLVEPILERNKIWFNENLSPLQRQAALWKDQDQNESWLLTDQALLEVKAWADEHQDELTETEHEFLEACQRLQRQNDEDRANEQRERENERKFAEEQARAAQTARRFSLVALSLVVIAFIALYFAVNSRQAAKNAQSTAEASAAKANLEEAKSKAAAATAEAARNEARASELSTIALDRSDTKLDLALLLALEADSMDRNSPQTQRTLATLLLKSNRYRGSLPDTADLQQIQYSPDGKIFAALDKNGITFWDSNSLNPLKDTSRINGHSSAITALALSHNGSYIASGSVNGMITIWDSDTQKTLGQPFKGHNGRISRLVFNSDDSILASASSDENTITLFNITDKNKPQILPTPLSRHRGGILSLAFSPKDNILASGGSDKAIILWDVVKGQSWGDPIREHQDWVTDLAFNGNGTILASASNDGRVILWDVRQPSKPSMSSDKISESLSIRSISIHDETLALGMNGGSISLWNISTPDSPSRIGASFKASETDITRLAFNPGGNLLASSSDRGTFTLWNVTTQEKLGEPIQDSSGLVSDFAFHGSTLITGSTTANLVFWDVTNPEKPKKAEEFLQDLPGQATSMQFSLDGRVLASYGDDHNLLFDVGTQKLLGVGSMTASPDGSLLAYQILDNDSGENIIRLTDAKTGNPRDTMPGQNPVFSPDGHMLVYETTTPDRTQTFFSVWDIAAAKNIVKNIEGKYLGMNPDSQTLLYSATNMRGETEINIWDIVNKSVIKSVSSSNFALSQNGEVLAFVTNDSHRNLIVNLLSTTPDRPLRKPVQTNSQYIYGLQLSQNGKVLAYTIYDKGNWKSSFLNTTTDSEIGDPVPGFINRCKELGQIFVCEINRNSENSILSINTSFGQKVGDLLKGSYVDLVQGDKIADGKILVYQTFENSTNNISLWNIDKQKGIGEPIQGSYMGINPSAGLLVTRNENESIIFWDVARTWPLGQLVSDQTTGASGATLSGDRKTFAWSGKEGIGLLDLDRSGLVTTPLRDHVADDIPGFIPVFSPDGKMLAIGSEGSPITLWDLGTMKQIPNVSFPGFIPAFSPDGKMLAIGTEGDTITLWNLKTMKKIEKASLSGFFPAFSPDGTVLAIGSSDNTTALWDLTTMKQIPNVSLSGDIPAFSPDGMIIAIGQERTSVVTFWDLKEGQTPTHHKVERPIPATGMIFSSDGKMLASLASDGLVLRNLETSKIFRLEASDYAGHFTEKMSFSADGKKFFDVGDDGALITWELSAPGVTISGKIDPFFPGSVMGISAFSPDGKYLLYQENDLLKIWDLLQGKGLTDRIQTSENSNSPGALAFGPDGDVLAYANSGTVTLYDFPNVKTQLGDPLAIRSNAITRVGLVTDNGHVRYILTTDESGSTQIWDWSSRTKIGEPFAGISQFVGSSPQEHTVIYLDSSGKLIKINLSLDHEAWQNLLCPLARRNLTHAEWTQYVSGKDYPTNQRDAACPQWPLETEATAALSATP